MSKLFETPSEKAGENLSARTAELAPVRPSGEFSLEQRRILLGIAHQAVLSAVENQNLNHGGTQGKARSAFPETPISAGLMEPRGVFTTLYLDGQLRGCVGYAVAVAPLYRAVAETARAAAFDDSRFLPVTMEEAPRLEVSLSVLSRLLPIRAEEVEVGRHGLFIAQGTRRGLLLPQVPVEHGWDRETFLEQACRKAGLPPKGWQTGAGTTIEAFTAEVFGDRDVEVHFRA